MTYRRWIVGVSGRYCSGKNTFSALLENCGYLMVDVDKIGHRVLEQKAADIISAFGRDILGEGNGIDRAKLGRVVFGDKTKLSLLEAILHPAMYDEVARIIEDNQDRNIVINAALLFKMGLHRFCDIIFCVRAPLYKLIFRGMRRDGLGFFDVLKRLLNQRGICFKPEGTTVDTYNVWNIGNVNKFERKALSLLKEKGLIAGE